MSCDISRQLSGNGEIRMHNLFQTQHCKITERLLDTSRFSRCTEINVQENHRLHIGANKCVDLLSHKHRLFVGEQTCKIFYCNVALF